MINIYIICSVVCLSTGIWDEISDIVCRKNVLYKDCKNYNNINAFSYIYSFYVNLKKVLFR